MALFCREKYEIGPCLIALPPSGAWPALGGHAVWQGEEGQDERAPKWAQMGKRGEQYSIVQIVLIVQIVQIVQKVLTRKKDPQGATQSAMQRNTTLSLGKEKKS